MSHHHQDSGEALLVSERGSTPQAASVAVSAPFRANSCAFAGTITHLWRLYSEGEDSGPLTGSAFEITLASPAPASLPRGHHHLSPDILFSLIRRNVELRGRRSVVDVSTMLSQ